MRKRIVIDGVIFGLQKAGGISRTFADILLEMDQTIGDKSDIIVLLPKNQSVEWQESAPQFKHIQVIKRKRFRWGKRGFLRDSLYLTLLAMKLRPDVWHTSYYSGLPFFPCKKVVTCYDMIPEKLKFATSYETKVKYKALRAAHVITTISENSRKDLVEQWEEFAPKITVIPCSVRKAAPSKGAARVPYFLFVGKRGGYKNFLPSVKALLADPRFYDYRIQVVGGEERLNPDEKKLGKRVKFLGIRPHEEVEKLIKGSSLLLFPSLYEGFGLPVLEAFAYGVPVLAMRSSSIPEVTGEEYPLADPNTPLSVVDVASTLLSERDKWIAYGHERKKLFTLDSMVNKLISTYALFDHHSHI